MKVCKIGGTKFAAVPHGVLYGRNFGDNENPKSILNQKEDINNFVIKRLEEVKINGTVFTKLQNDESKHFSQEMERMYDDKKVFSLKDFLSLKAYTEKNKAFLNRQIEKTILPFFAVLQDKIGEVDLNKIDYKSAYSDEKTKNFQKELEFFRKKSKFIKEPKPYNAENITNSIIKQRTFVCYKNNQFCFNGNKNNFGLEAFLTKFAKNPKEIKDLFNMVKVELFGFLDDSSKDMPFIDLNKVNKSELDNIRNEKDKKEYLNKELSTLITNKLGELSGKIKKLKDQTNDLENKNFKLFWFYKSYEFTKALIKSVSKKYTYVFKRDYNKEEERKEKEKIKVERFTNQFVLNHVLGKLKNYICSKIIALGKALNLKYDTANKKLIENDLTSIDFETQKAYDSVKQSQYVAISFSKNTMINILKPQPQKEFFLESQSFAKNINDKYILFKGNINNGIECNFQEKDIEKYFFPNVFSGVNEVDFINESIEAIDSLRNDNFHFFESNANPTIYTIKEVVKKEIKKLNEVVIEKLNSVEAKRYFFVKDINNLINKAYENASSVLSYIPKFTSIFNQIKKEESFTSIISRIPSSEGAIEFLLEKLYYHNFLSIKNGTIIANEFFWEAIKKAKEKDFEHKKEIDIFCEVFGIDIESKTGFDSFNNLSCLISQEVSRLINDSNKDGEFIKIFFVKIISEAFLLFVNKNYSFVFNPQVIESQENFNISIIKTIDESAYSMYLLAKLIPNSTLNFLINDYRKYLQFFQDINLRSNSLNQNEIENTNETISKCLNIINALSLASEFKSYELSNFKDIDEKNKKTYELISPYIGCQEKSLKEFLSNPNYDGVYHDGTNIILQNHFSKLEFFGIEKLLTQIVKSSNYIVSIDEIKTYKNFQADKDVKLQSKKIENQDDINKYQNFIQNKNKVELHDIFSLNSLIIEAVSSLIECSYKWERDSFYFLFGLQYLLKNDLCDIFTIFDYNSTVNPATGEGKAVTKKLESFFSNSLIKNIYENFFGAFDSIRPIQKSIKSIKPIRNSIDHFDYIKKTNESIIEMFSDARKLNSYDIKIKNGIMPKLYHSLEKMQLKFHSDFVNKDVISIVIKPISSIFQKITENNSTKQQKEKAIYYTGKSESFSDLIGCFLKYKK
ncbi:MAG: type VI-A CRISPR-associated RNA-guided ribonuclease Cas13a [Clostridia bacterium]